MSTKILAKRRRGGQPGNQNAKGNRGNPHPRRNYRNKGGGAPPENQNARRRSKAQHEILLKDYGQVPEAVAWINDHAAELGEADFTDDDQRDPALYCGYLGMTPERLAEQGQEYRRGLYEVLPEDFQEDEDLAA